MVANISFMGQAERPFNDNGHLRPVTKVQKSNQVAASILTHPGRLGSGGVGNKSGHKQQTGGKQPVSITGNSLYGSTIKRLTAMAEAKTILMFLDFLGVPVFAYAFLLNIGDLKGYVLFSIAVLYGIARLVFYVIKGVQDAQLRRLDIREREIDVDERESEHEA